MENYSRIYLYFNRRYTYSKFSLNKITAWLINLFTGKYFHVGVFKFDDINNPDAIVYESWAGDGGVVKTTFKNNNHDTKYDVYYVEVTQSEKERIFEFLEKKAIAKTPYDFKGAISVVFRFLEQDKNKYFCSELVNDAFLKAGIFLCENTRPSPHEVSQSTKIVPYKLGLSI